MTRNTLANDTSSLHIRVVCSHDAVDGLAWLAVEKGVLEGNGVRGFYHSIRGAMGHTKILLHESKPIASHRTQQHTCKRKTERPGTGDDEHGLR